MYFGIIVTTAKLQICRYDPNAISLGEGKISNATFEEVPYLRFRKQMSVDEKRTSGLSIFQDHREYSRAKENTVLLSTPSRSLSFLKILKSIVTQRTEHHEFANNCNSADAILAASASLQQPAWRRLCNTLAAR